MTHITTYFSLVFTMFLWGGTFIAGRLLSEVMAPAPAAFLRFAIATLSLFLIILLSTENIHRPSAKQWLGLSLLGVSGVFAYNVFFFYGLSHINAGRAALIIAFNPLAITLLALFFFNEKFSFLKGIGILLSITGAVFVISNGHPSVLFKSGFGKGELALIGCVASWSTYTIIGKKMLSTISPLSSVFYSSLIGTALLFIPAAFSGLFNQLQALTIQNWFELSYLGIFGTAIGFSLYYSGIKKIGATRAGVFINLVPLFAILLAWIALGETIKPSVLTGGVMILTGVALANYLRPQPSTQKNS